MPRRPRGATTSHRTVSLLLNCVLLGLALNALHSTEPVDRVKVRKEGALTVPIYAPPAPDGRVVLMVGESAAPDGEPDAAAAAEIAGLVSKGCMVAFLEVAPGRAESGASEKTWAPVMAAVAKHTKNTARLVFLPPGFQLADPIPLNADTKDPVFLDVSFRPSGAPRPMLVRVRSGLFGAEPMFAVACGGYALVHVPDPFAELQMDGPAAIEYGRRIATTLRAHAKPLRLNGSIAIGGKSKHGFSASVMGAGASIPGTPADGRYQAVLAFTDTYDPETRAEDFRAAGHKVDDSPGGPDPRSSAVRLIQPGGPAFFLRDAHGRTSRQAQRMMDALEVARVPYLQSWYPDKPHYAAPTTAAIRAFLDTHCAQPPQSGSTPPAPSLQSTQ